MYKRFAEEKIKRSIDFSPATMIVGPRQSGKTTLIQACADHRKLDCLSFDDLRLLNIANEAPGHFFQTYPPPLILDEIQRAPQLFLPMKMAIDQNRTNGMFMLTGSANPMMLPGVGDSLAGRLIMIPLWPLSQGELADRQEQFIDVVFEEQLPKTVLPPFSLEELLHKIIIGGYPTMQTLQNDAMRFDWCSTYLHNILHKDVRELAQIEKLGQLPNLLEIIAIRSGTMLNVTELSRSTQIPRTTMQRYLQYLETLFMIHLLPPWHTNSGKRLVKSPKIYLNDTGILSHLCRIDQSTKEIALAIKGRLIETFAVIELQKQLSWRSTHHRLYYYRDQRGHEIDILIEGPDRSIVAIEVKAKSHIKSDDFKGIRHFANTYSDRFRRGIILYPGNESNLFGNNLISLPINSIWEL